jgi:N-acyl-D-amino-acid deacylase
MSLDLIIRGGSVVDGSRDAKAALADVGIRGDRIVAIEPPGGLADATAAREIDATGRIVSPGFIDAHTHTEIALPQTGAKGRFANLLQGVTTIMTAPDGFGWAPLPAARARELWRSTIFATGPADAGWDFDWTTPEKYLAIFDGRVPENVVPMAPHNAIRFAAMGWEPRVATDAELEVMRRATRAWMEAGAVGLNGGLDYQPGANSDTRELVELGKVVAEFGGVYAAHMRYAGVGIRDAFRETMRVSTDARIPVSVAHYQYETGSKEWIDEADAAGEADFSFESYMYPAGSTHFLMSLPLSEQVGGPDALQERMRDSTYRDRIIDGLNLVVDANSTSKARAYFSETRTGRFIGQTMPEAAASLNITVPEFVRILVEDELPDALLVYHRGFTDEEFEPIVRATISHPRMMVASDGIAHGALPHPRGAGCFARVLRYQVREIGAVSLEHAIHKMSGFVAERYRIRDRGLLRTGYGADVVIFDPATVADRSTWTEPRLEPVGIDAVIVNGRVVADHGRWTGELPGRVLRPLSAGA